MKIYTKKGDQGNTSLYDGTKSEKSDIIFQVLGELDELTSRIGLICSFFKDDTNTLTFLRSIQYQIQTFNSYIATPNKTKNLPIIETNIVQLLEQEIDKINETLEPLTVFIIPGKTQEEAHIHLCRTQTRKVERYINIYKNNSNNWNIFGPILLQYINRLSDYFFTLARTKR